MDDIFELPKIKNYDRKRREVERLVSKRRGRIPEGFKNPFFMNCLIRVLDYLEEVYGKRECLSAFIPDKEHFMQTKSHYSMRELALNRIVKNVKDIHFEKKATPLSGKDEIGADAEYIPRLGLIKFYVKEEDFGSEVNFITNHSFISDYDLYFIYKRMQCLIHEILHAISDNGKMIGFSSIADTDEFASLDEGVTESLSLEICGLNNIYRQTLLFDEHNNGYGTRGNILTGYLFETGIAKLIRLASNLDIVEDYLTDGDMSTFGFGKENLYRPPHRKGYLGLTPFECIKKFMSTINYYQPSQKDLQGIQWLQASLLEDMLRDKFDLDNMQNYIDNGIEAEVYSEIKSKVIDAGRYILLKYGPLSGISNKEVDELTFEKFSVPIGITDTSERLETLILEGIIEDTPNVKNYRNLLRRIEFLKKYVIEKNDTEDKAY